MQIKLKYTNNSFVRYSIYESLRLAGSWLNSWSVLNGGISNTHTHPKLQRGILMSLFTHPHNTTEKWIIIKFVIKWKSALAIFDFVCTPWPHYAAPIGSVRVFCVSIIRIPKLPVVREWLHSRSLSLWHYQVCNMAGDDCSKQHIKCEWGVLPLGVPSPTIFIKIVLLQKCGMWWFSDLQRERWYIFVIILQPSKSGRGIIVVEYDMMVYDVRRVVSLSKNIWAASATTFGIKIWVDFVRQIQIKFSFNVLSVQLNRFAFQFICRSRKIRMVDMRHISHFWF